MTKKEAAALAAQQSGAMDTDSVAPAPSASDGSVLQRLTGEALRAPSGPICVLLSRAGLPGSKSGQSLETSRVATSTSASGARVIRWTTVAIAQE